MLKHNICYSTNEISRHQALYRGEKIKLDVLEAHSTTIKNRSKQKYPVVPIIGTFFISVILFNPRFDEPHSRLQSAQYAEFYDQNFLTTMPVVR